MRSETKSTPEIHPGLDNDEATEPGKTMTASGSVGPVLEADAENPDRSADAFAPGADGAH